MECDSCGGRIGGPRLFCLDCTIKTKKLYDTLDLCCAPQCVSARVIRPDLEDAHEPSHRLVKARTTVLTRSHGRIHALACDAFERVDGTRRKIAEFISHRDEETGPDEQKISSLGSTSTEMPAKSDKPRHLNPPDGTKGTPNVEGMAAREARQDQNLPMCGKCKGHLSFPFWYCIFCGGKSQEQHSSPVRAECMYCAVR